MPFKVAIYSGAIPSTVFIERLIEGLAEHDTRIFLFGRQNARVAYPTKNVHCLGYTHRFNQIWQLFKYGLLLVVFKPKALSKLFQINRKLQNHVPISLWVQYLGVLWHRPDIFHIQWAKSIKYWMWVQDFGIRLVLSLRGAHINYSPLLDASLAEFYRANFPRLVGFHAVSRAIAREAQQYGANMHVIQVIYSGIDVDKMPFRQPGHKNKTVLRILSVGRDHWKKGYHYAIDACALLAGQLKFDYTIIGGRSEEYVFQVHQLGLVNRVHLLDTLPHQQVINTMNEADVLLLPSVEEGIANVVLEAMAIGLPVISTRCGGMEEVIQHGENGFLVDVRNPKQIAQALVDFLNMPEEQKHKMLINARKTIEERFQQKKMAREMLELYDKVLKNSTNSCVAS